MSLIEFDLGFADIIKILPVEGYFVQNKDMLLPSEATKHSEQRRQQHVYKLIVSWVWNTGI